LLLKRKAKVIGLQINPILVFRFFKTSQVSSNFYLPLIPLFQSFFFQFSLANLGGKILLAAEFLLYH
jgi:hypothetical protein